MLHFGTCNNKVLNFPRFWERDFNNYRFIITYSFILFKLVIFSQDVTISNMEALSVDTTLCIGYGPLLVLILLIHGPM